LALTAQGLFFSSAQAAEAEKIKVLIVTGFDVPSHPWRETTPQAREVLESSGRFDVKVSEDIGIFESSSLEKYDVVVLNYGFWNEPEPSAEGKAGLLDYVKQGGGLVPLHFSCSSFQDWDEYASLLGRVWVKGVGGHGPRSTFTVNITDKDHPITEGMSDFQMDDELYAKLSGEADIQVLATADSDWSGKTEPMVFVKKYGEGRVVHNVLGHDVKARDNEAFAKLLRRGVEWAATGQVTVD
jgi:type 1 glutamine amidotransferase